MYDCLLRIVIHANRSGVGDVELRHPIGLGSFPAIGADLRPVACHHHDVPPLTVRRILGTPTDEQLIVDLDDVQGRFEKILAAMIYEGWRPHLEFSFDDEGKAREFAEDHGESLIHIGPKFYAVSPAVLWCVDRSRANYERVGLRYERN